LSHFDPPCECENEKHHEGLEAMKPANLSESIAVRDGDLMVIQIFKG